MKTLLVLVVLALVAASSALPFVSETENAIAQFKSQFNALFSEEQSDLKDAICSYKDSASGASFNWKSLKGKEFEGFDPTDGEHYKYKLTMCGTSSDPECAKVEGSICQYDMKDSNKYVGMIASFSKSPAPTFSLIKPGDASAGVEATFTNGDQCYKGWQNVDRQVKVRFTCASSNKLQVDETEDCVYVVEFANTATCGGGDDDGLSGGAIFLIILMVSVILYVGVGVGICYKKYEKRGIEACPHKDFWFSIPGLVKDGVVFTIGKIKGLCGSSTITTSSGEYEAA